MPPFTLLLLFVTLALFIDGSVPFEPATTPSNNHMAQRNNDAVAFHRYASYTVELSNAHVTKVNDNVHAVTVQRSVRDIDFDRRRKYLYTLLQIDNDDDAWTTPPQLSMPHELPESIVYRLASPSGNKVAIFEWDYLVLWEGAALVQRIPLPKKPPSRVDKEQQQKGVVVADSTFGYPCWNGDESKLVFGMERPSPHTCSFFAKNNQNNNDDDETIVGGQHVLGIGQQEEWGEGYEGKSPHYDWFVVTLNDNDDDTGNPIIDQLPAVSNGTTMGQPVFCKDDSIVMVGWNSDTTTGKRLGLRYCIQRPCRLYYLRTTQKDAQWDCLTPDYSISFSPRFQSHTNTLVFLTSPRGFDTHFGCLSLAKMDLETRQCTILVNATEHSHGETVANLPFPGLFLQQLPTHCFLNNDNVLLNTQWGSCQKVVRVSLQDGSIQRIDCDPNHPYSSDEVLCCCNNRVVVSCQTPDQAAVLRCVTVDDALQNDVSKADSIQLPPIASSKMSPVSALLLDTNVQFDIQSIEAPHVDSVSVRHDIQSILLLPKKRSDNKKPPLVVVPHGGPHSVSSTKFLPSYAFLCGHGGYAVLLVNYRGSLGFGQTSIEALPSRIGELDLQDVMAATKHAQVSGLVDPNRIGICGGSHGGYLTAQATSRHANVFRAAVMRNPVVNLPAMFTSTDIPDWCLVEAMGSYHCKSHRPLTAHELQICYDKSPIKNVQHVQTPTLVALGLKDLRVPPSQGLEWFHSIRGRVPTKLLLYQEDNHAIDKVASEADHWIHIKQWFDKHLLGD